MIGFSPAKINLGLHVLFKRDDGYHEIETIFYPVPWFDAVEIISAPQLTLHLSGMPIPGNPDDNLCMKAYRLVKQDFPDLPAVAIYLHKTIPSRSRPRGRFCKCSHCIATAQPQVCLTTYPRTTPIVCTAIRQRLCFLSPASALLCHRKRRTA